MKFCPNCGAQVDENAVVCVKCGVALRNQPQSLNVDNRWLVTVLLCFFLGALGIHRFYVGKTGSGILQLLTGGGCGVWAIIDFIMILTGNFTDAEGKVVAIIPTYFTSKRGVESEPMAKELAQALNVHFKANVPAWEYDEEARKIHDEEVARQEKENNKARREARKAARVAKIRKKMQENNNEK